LDGWVKTPTKADGSKVKEKNPVKEPPRKKEKPQKPAPKAKAKRKESKVEDIPETEAPGDETATEDKPKESVLKALGMVQYELSCPGCKFKRKLSIQGDIKPYQLVCKKCGGQMVVKKQG